MAEETNYDNYIEEERSKYSYYKSINSRFENTVIEDEDKNESNWGTNNGF